MILHAQFTHGVDAVYPGVPGALYKSDVRGLVSTTSSSPQDLFPSPSHALSLSLSLSHTHTHTFSLFLFLSPSDPSNL